MGAGAVFISYRREDSEGQARALSIALGELIGKDSVFMDVDGIGLGRDFRQVLQERLQACEIVLVLIGPNWLEAKDADGNRRLDNPGDFVRQEIASALKRSIIVTPVLLQGASMPGSDRLPPDLQDLAYRNGFEISHTRWVSDVKELFKRLGLMARTNSYEVSLGRLSPSSPFDSRFAAAGTVAQGPAATHAAIPTTMADIHAPAESNAGNAVDPVAPADDVSKPSAPPRKQMRRAIIAAAVVFIMAVLTLASYISMRKKTTDTIVQASTIPATTVAATTVAATAVAATTAPATDGAATTVPATDVAATTVPETDVAATTVPTVSEVTVPEILKVQQEDAEGIVTAANLNAVVVKDWNQDAEQDSVIESDPPPGSKVNPGGTVTLHVSAPGGWAHFGKEDGLEAGKTLAITKSMSLHVVDDKKSRQSGSVDAGKSVRVIEVGGHGWAKVVVTD
jgi:TIR domain/PASTA domain